MKKWIEVKCVSTGRRVMLNVDHIMWVTSAQHDGSAYSMIQMINGTSLLVGDEYDFLKDDILEASED